MLWSKVVESVVGRAVIKGARENTTKTRSLEYILRFFQGENRWRGVVGFVRGERENKKR